MVFVIVKQNVTRVGINLSIKYLSNLISLLKYMDPIFDRPCIKNDNDIARM